MHSSIEKNIPETLPYPVFYALKGCIGSLPLGEECQQDDMPTSMSAPKNI
jgi:hypothetical protein